MFIDHSVVEIYSGDASNILTFRLYPTSADALGITLVAQDADVVFDIQAWSLALGNSTLSARDRHSP